jgi:hypothetical protein
MRRWRLSLWRVFVEKAFDVIFDIFGFEAAAFQNVLRVEKEKEGGVSLVDREGCFSAVVVSRFEGDCLGDSVSVDCASGGSKWARPGAPD